ALVECIGEEVSVCDQVSICVIRDIWRDVQDSVLEALDSVSLESVCRRKIERDNEGASMYHI
ncbi:MAG: hypothetical protein WA148_02380, partial [Actinomycetota bacterium]